ncbi:CHAT domain-containing protein [Streptomyces sp. NPDC006553]|uniref:CHAT domain-containing protein n=1 Tax=unclassified Streptomyces TaxID=2593676 RepID=UPI00225A286F|nr:CHAT domain-containing protein [Streptomyces sp. NBC_00233]MCX5231998.1 CHAT domain-containing protein [Streptomyces sp. NBC_00233]
MVERSTFALEISGGEGRYSVTATSGTSPPVSVRDVSLNVERIRERSGTLQNESRPLSTRGGSRKTAVALRDRDARAIGDELFGALFPGEVGGLYAERRQQAAARGENLRMMLRMTAPELTTLPWELIHNPDFGFLCLEDEVVRCVDLASLPLGPPPTHLQVRVTGMVSAPPFERSLNVKGEERNLRKSLQRLTERKFARLRWVNAVNWTTLMNEFTAESGGCHVFHYVGHGAYDSEQGAGALVFSDELGRRQLISGDSVGRAIQQAPLRPQLVVLNGCETGKGSHDELFSSVAAALLQFVPAVVAMQFAVTDAAAVAFSRYFYQALVGLGRPVDMAVHQGRVAMLLQDEHSLEWATPVLYVRDDRDIRLFDGGNEDAPKYERAVEGVRLDEERLIAVQASKSTRIHGNPVLIQKWPGGSTTARPGKYTPSDFELVFPGPRSGLVSMCRRNSVPGVPWGPPCPIEPDLGQVDAIGMVESRLGEGRSSLEVVARTGEDLRFLWNDSEAPTNWHAAPTPIADRAAGNPTLLQTRHGDPGDLHLVCPAAGGGLMFMRRRNDIEGHPWTTPYVFARGRGEFAAVGMVERDAGDGRSSLDVVARTGDELRFFWNETGEATDWQELEDPIVRGATGNPVLIQDRTSEPGDLLLVCPAADGGMVFLRRRNGVAGLPWTMPYVLAEELEVTAVTMIQSTYGGRDGCPGANLELIARVGDSLEFFWKGPRPAFWIHNAFGPQHPLVDALSTPESPEPSPEPSESSAFP